MRPDVIIGDLILLPVSQFPILLRQNHSVYASVMTERAGSPEGAGCDIDRRRTMMAVRAQLSYDVLVSGLAPVHDDAMPDGGKPHWSPLAHTLIHGPTEAVVVDPPITVAQTNALADWIESFGKTLRHIYITHWHADHWLGTSQLLGRFPG